MTCLTVKLSNFNMDQLTYTYYIHLMGSKTKQTKLLVKYTQSYRALLYSNRIFSLFLDHFVTYEMVDL